MCGQGVWVASMLDISLKTQRPRALKGRTGKESRQEEQPPGVSQTYLEGRMYSLGYPKPHQDAAAVITGEIRTNAE